MGDTLITKRGSELHGQDQKYVLAAYVHRYTGEHKPQWANKPWRDGQAYPVQFASDAEWLADSTFTCSRKTGRIDRRIPYCHSYPTWPDNPELRLDPPARHVDGLTRE